MTWTLGELARVMGGSVVGAEAATTVSGPSIDSRRIHGGELFIALVGERTDGHEHAADALAAGAVAALVARPIPGPHVLVTDPAAALTAWAAAHRRRLGMTVVGLTGSAGKTTTKDLVADVLAAVGPTVATHGSYNNEIGLPLTVLSATATDEFLVLEMGARGRGHIAALCEVAAPDIGVVLNVGHAHVGEFGDLAATALAKGELVESLAVAGTAVLNRDDPLVAEMADRTPASVLWFGRSSHADVRANDVSMVSGCARFELQVAGSRAPVALQLVGQHQVSNALAAAAVGHVVGLGVAEIAAALSQSAPKSRWRMEVVDLPHGVTLVNDAYNANPDSMRAGLDAVAALADGRRILAVLGPMGELGTDSVRLHEEVGAYAASLGAYVLGVGQDADALVAGAVGADGSGTAVTTVAAAVEWLRQELRPADVVLVKASRSAGLERVVHELQEVSA
jgi:UDP-N-acetylmuramoyl-tripeptide--D-alanyl-D-alanine ligase